MLPRPRIWPSIWSSSSKGREGECRPGSIGSYLLSLSLNWLNLSLNWSLDRADSAAAACILRKSLQAAEEQQFSAAVVGMLGKCRQAAEERHFQMLQPVCWERAGRWLRSSSFSCGILYVEKESPGIWGAAFSAAAEEIKKKRACFNLLNLEEDTGRRFWLPGPLFCFISQKKKFFICPDKILKNIWKINKKILENN